MTYEIIEAKYMSEAVSKSKFNQNRLGIVESIKASANSDKTYTVTATFVPFDPSILSDEDIADLRTILRNENAKRAMHEENNND